MCLCRGGGVQTDVCVCVIPLCGTLFCFVLFLSPAYRSVGSTEVSITYILFMYSTKHKHTLLLALHRLRWSLSSSEFTIGTALLSPLALRRPFYHNHSIRIFVVPTCHSTLWCVCRDVAERIPPLYYVLFISSILAYADDSIGETAYDDDSIGESNLY